jgi:alkylation response protein AidB-like acyl-CoA dehydrogenase
LQLDLTQEQSLIAESVSRFTERAYTFEQRRELLAAEADGLRKNWATFAELGWLGASLPESAGGMGGGLRDTMLILEGLGQALALEPVSACAFYPARLIQRLADAAQADALLAEIISGETLYAVAHSEPCAAGRPDYVGCAAHIQAGEVTLSGRKSMVLGAPQAARFLVSVRLAAAPQDNLGVAVLLLDRSDIEARMTPYRLHDGRHAADLDLDGLRARESAVLGRPGQALPALIAAFDEATIGGCAEAVGAMDRTLWLTRDYLKTREQFGVPIGSFQVLQHAMADMLIELEQSRSMLLRGMAALDGADATRSKAVSAAKAFISRSALEVGKAAIQLHGAIGLTDEYIVSHYFKRLFCFSRSYGEAQVHYERFRQL